MGRSDASKSAFTYMKACQRFLKDQNQELVDPGDIIEYINVARREVAMRGQCIRLLPVISGSIVSIPIPVVSGWTAPVTVAISPPDSPSGALPFPNGSQATATATLFGGAISDVEVTYGGYGYFQPQAVFTDATGHTITSFPVTTNNNLLEPRPGDLPVQGRGSVAVPRGQVDLHGPRCVGPLLQLPLLAAVLFVHDLPGDDPAGHRLSVPVRAHVRCPTRSRDRRLALPLPAPKPGVPDGVGLLLPAIRPECRPRR